MSATIHDVAKKAGVSVSTASRVLNGGTKGLRRDAAARAELVLKTAKELAYSPNSAARGLVLKRSFSIGLIGGELNNPVRSRLIETLRERALEKGFSLLVAGVDFKDDSQDAIENLLSRRVDSLILANLMKYPEKRLAKLFAEGFPIISFGQAANLPWDNVRIDYAAMTYELVRHLVETHGLKRMAFAGLAENHPRFESFAKALADAGLPKRAGVFWKARGADLEAGRLLALETLRKEAAPEAVVCHNDILALGVMAGLREAGLSCPGDIAVTGLDDIEFAAYSNPPLSSAGVESARLADELVELLFARLDGGGGTPVERPCRSRIALRESCGCRQTK